MMPMLAKPLEGEQPLDQRGGLFAAIGAFLSDQRLDPTPANYAFAYRVLTEPDSVLARTVAALTEGGVRLTRRDLEELQALTHPGTPAEAPQAGADAQKLVARVQHQVEGFGDMVEAIRAETAGFGRDLEATAGALDRSRRESTHAANSLDEIARVTAAMIERARTAEARLACATQEARALREELERARDCARRDPLTTLANRRGIEEAFASHAEAGDEIALAVCDVDHFKSVNDRFGHAVGDRVLKAIAACLTEHCGNHLVGRYGGEEFAVLFTGIAAAEAETILDRARAALAVKRFRQRETDEVIGTITFSVGLAEAQPGESFAACFRRADERLYAAKANGRNCIVSE